MLDFNVARVAALFLLYPKATPASGVDNDPARQESGNDPGMVSSSISVSADKFKDFEDFIKAVLAPLVHLLSFDHIR